jgi:mutual gliding-motility protein MglA
MVLFNYSTRELTTKIVYYGPGLCGKTTNLQFIHKNLPEAVKGKMLSLATKTDRTLFFDFLPMDLGEIRGMKTRLQLYTVPGQVFYNETRKLVLKGVDGIVFVADSQQEMLAANQESFRNLEDNLKGHGLTLAEMPHVIQFNKRDLPKLTSLEELNAGINKHNAPFYESVATTGIGVQDTLKAITKLVLLNLTRKYEPKIAASTAKINVPAGVPVGVPAMAAVAATDAAAAAVPAAILSPAQTGATGSAAGGTRKSKGKSARAGAAAPVATAATAEPTLPDMPVDDVDLLVDEIQGYRGGAGASIDAPMPAVPAAASERTTIENLSVRLTEQTHDRDLFDDPSLEVARVMPGQTREIVVPVQIGDLEAGGRRYKLSFTLRLDAVE